MAALMLCQVTARLVRLDPAKVWDAALVMALAAFVISRALLVVGSWRSFLEAPMLMLALPSLNDTGILLTALVMVVYLRWKRLPLLAFLDAMAPCFALAWAFLSLGDILAGTRDGMPTQFFVAVGRNAAGNGGVHPVEVYALFAGLFLCGILIRALAWEGVNRRPVGLVFGLGLGLAGLVIFVLDFLRLPGELFVAAMLDPVQWLGLAMMVMGVAVWIALPFVPSEMPPATVQTGRSDAL